MRPSHKREELLLLHRIRATRSRTNARLDKRVNGIQVALIEAAGHHVVLRGSGFARRVAPSQTHGLEELRAHFIGISPKSSQDPRAGLRS